MRTRSWSLLAAVMALPAALSWACSGATPPPNVCSEYARCAGDRTCVMGRCRKPGTMPVSTDAPRLSFQPEDLAWLTREGAHGPLVVDDTFVLGKAGDDSALLLRFAVTLPPGRRLQRAILKLDPMPRCGQTPGRLAVSVAHILAPWRSSELSAATRPPLSLPIHVADTAATPPRALMADVTEVVREWQAHRKRYHGLALSASGASESGACYTTGLSHGRGPRLDIYLWPEQDAGSARDAGTDGATDAGGGAAGDAGDGE
jgi:hypothetical protein